MATIERETCVQSYSIKSWAGSWLGWLKWNSFDDNMLRAAEKKILSYLKTPYRGHFVELRGVVDCEDKIWTISLNENSKKTPIVLLHGLASGSALWCKNLDALAGSRPVHAIDILGFAQSSRPKFSDDAKEVEKQFVESVEAWRREMQLEKMVLLGHSMGGFLASSYALKYPERVQHLILADPWGFPPKPDEPAKPGRQIPLWAKPIIYVAQKFYPLSVLRATGPFGQWLVETARPDIIRQFQSLLLDDIRMIPQYIHQCNVQRPSGEMAFTSMSSSYGWAKHPMIERIGQLDVNVPLTVIYGGRSWVDNSSGEEIKERRTKESYNNIVVLQGAAHHLYAEKSDVFNKEVNDACQKTENSDTI